MLFRRKPPVWQWDDRFSIFVHHHDATAPAHHYDYTIPFDHYAHLIAGSWHLTTCAGGADRQVRLLCWRGQYQLYAPAFGNSWAPSKVVQENFGLSATQQETAVAPVSIIIQSIPNAYLHPGDRITLDLINAGGTCHVANLYLTFKFWNV